MNDEELNNMSYNLFESILEELGKKLHYEGVVNFAGNSFAKDSWKMIQEAFPLAPSHDGPGGAFAAFLNG